MLNHSTGVRQKTWIRKDDDSDWWEVGCQPCGRIVHISMPWSPDLYQWAAEHLTSHWGRS